MRPIITNRRVTIHKNFGIFSFFCERHIFGFSATRTNHNIEIGKIKFSKSIWPKNPSQFVLAAKKRHFLQKTCVHFSSFEHFVLHKTNARKNFSVWKHRKKLFDHEFCAPKIDEPIRHNCNFFVVKMIHNFQKFPL